MNLNYAFWIISPATTLNCWISIINMYMPHYKSIFWDQYISTTLYSQATQFAELSDSRQAEHTVAYEHGTLFGIRSVVACNEPEVCSVHSYYLSQIFISAYSDPTDWSAITNALSTRSRKHSWVRSPAHAYRRIYDSAGELTTRTRVWNSVL